MDYERLKQELTTHDFKYKEYVSLVIMDAQIRTFLVQNIVSKTHINLYFNSYLLIEAVCEQTPQLFYEDWDAFLPLLTHKNSYHRTIAHRLLTLLLKVDRENKFDQIKDRYFSMIQDEKFLTGFLALKNIIATAFDRKDLEEETIITFLNEELRSHYSPTQKIKFRYEILIYFNELISRGNRDQRILDDIKKDQDSPIPKIKKLANLALKNTSRNAINLQNKGV